MFLDKKCIFLFGYHSILHEKEKLCSIFTDILTPCTVGCTILPVLK